MKKIYSLLIISLFVGLQCFGQQYINLYQDDVIIKKLSTEEIDSMSITETEPHIINFWYDGEIFLNYNSAGIDSITITNKGGAPFSYAGIVGFNSELKTKEIGILSSSTKSQYESFVNNLSCKDGTILYYAVDSVLNMLENANIETPLQSVHVITFTDGLDQGSLMLTDKYGSSVEYLNSLSERIPQTQLSGLSPQFYSVGLRGSDVSNIELFRQNLKHLASSDANAFEVSDISDLRSKFNNIANQIISVSTRQAVSVKVPGIENGTRMRFVFDNKTAENSQLYIEGRFNLQDRCLHDVVYQGIKAVSGKTVQGTQDGIFLTYTFTGMRPESGTSLIPTSSVKHYNKYPSSTTWQINSEFSPASSSQQNVSHSGTAIFLILDCSNSLKSQFSLIQQYAKEFLNLIANKAEPFELLAPKNVKAVLDDNRLVANLSWDAVNYSQSYEIYRSSASSGTYTIVANGVTTNSWTDENPLQGTNYYKVCAVGYGQISSRSSYASVNVPSLASPTNVKAELDSLDDRYVVNVTWDAVKYAQNYKVFRSSSYNGTYTLLADGVTTNSWIDESPLGTNYYKICAVGYEQTSTLSSYASLSVDLAAPTNVKAELDDKDLFVNLSWDAVKFAQSYKVYRNSTSYGTYSLLVDGITDNSWIDESPLQGTNYYYVCAVGYGLITISSYASVSVSLATPTNVKAVLDDNRLVTNVSWDAVKYAQSYEVYRSSTSNGTYTLLADGVTTNSWTDENPLQGTNYYKICAVGYGQTSSQSSYASVNIPTLEPPTNIKTELDVKDESFIVKISWDAVKYAQSYKVYRSSSANGTYMLVADGITDNAWIDESPLQGTNYYKICAVGYGQISSQSSFASVSVSLANPTNVKAELDVDDDKFIVKVSWDAVKYAQSYKVYRSSSSNGTYTLVADGVTTNSWTDENPLQDTNYYKVCAVGYGQNSSRSSYASVNIPSLASPTNVKAELDSLDDRYVVNVSWDVVKFAQCYKVYRSSTSNGTYTLVEDGITDNAWTDKSPLGGNNYYKVSAVGYGQISSQSSYAYLSVYLATPTNVKAELDDKDLFVNVSWDVVKFAQCYKVYRSYHESGTYALVADNITDNSWTDKNPLNGISFYKISAEGYGMMSSQSNYCWVQCYDTSKDTPEYVDLGLPSGLKWADRNIGASNPEDYGVYFAQGETEPKTDYSWNTYKWGSSKDLLTKYCTNSSYGLNGFTDNKTSLDLEDDAAHMNWSGEWRMPTKADFEELINNTNLERVTNYKGTGVAGFLFTASNGNHIFLPAAGSHYDTSKFGFAGSAGYYWSSSLNTRFPYVAYSLLLTADKVSVANYFLREKGCSVRPVRF